jgi:spore germination protein YaaH
MKAKILNYFSILIILIVTAGALLVYSYTVWTIPAYDEGSKVLVIEDKVFEHNAYISQGEHLLVSYNIIKSEIDPFILWDDKEQKVTLTTANKTVRLKTDSLTALVNSRPVTLEFPVTIRDGIPYLPVDFVSDMLGIRITKPLPNVVILDFLNKKREVGKILKASHLKISPSWLSPVRGKVGPGAEVNVYGKNQDWMLVRTREGVFGYVSQNNLEVTRMTYTEPKPEPKPSSSLRGKINLVWDYVHTTSDGSRLPDIKALDVISPTWFSVTDENGIITNKADIRYVERAHEKGYQVWALINNNFDPEITSKFLNSTSARENIIAQLLLYADLYELDGINVDFENVYLKDRDMLTQLVREITPVLREQGLVVSMDVTIKSTNPNWSMCYDRKALGEIVDYLALMAYDEHWATSPISGPVASINWVERGIKTLLDEVPPEKVLLGLPFYTREWEETPKDLGGVSVKSKALSMAAVKQKIQETGAKITWDQSSGTNFLVYRKGNTTYKIWVEDASSIDLKTDLVQKYNLAGTAAWRLGYEQPEIWDVLYTKIKARIGHRKFKKLFH